MIIANVKPGPQNCLLLQFSNPDEVFTDQQYQTIRGTYQDVRRMLYFRNRKYVTETLGSWLKQRKRAIEERPNQDFFLEKIQMVTILRDMVLHHSFSSLWSLCDYVALKNSDLEFIAPSESSRHYKYYNTTIVPIIQYCLQESSKR